MSTRRSKDDTARHETSFVLGPSLEAVGTSDETVFVPRPYGDAHISHEKLEALRERGLAFRRSDFPDGDPARFIKHGIVSEDRTMVVIFCDLKGSTVALRALRERFRHEVQSPFLNSCSAAVDALKHHGDIKRTRLVIDKFMGDGALMYVDCGNSPAAGKGDATWSETCTEAVNLTMKLIARIVGAVEDRRGGGTDGVRFGIAMGDAITLSVLGCDGHALAGTVGDFTVTGETVNLAARLEHASPAEFLAAISRSRAQAEIYASKVQDQDRLRGSELGEAMSVADNQIIDLYDACEKTYEVRANERFRLELETANVAHFAWRTVPLLARGFSDVTTVHLLGGHTLEALLRSMR